MNEKKYRILLAEDDTNLGNLLKEYLIAKGYHASLNTNGVDALNDFKKNKYDLCILDIMMPLKDGFTLAREIRNIDSIVPIIFLTAKSMKQDMIEGFEIGADDYITKPFSMEVLLLRINAILRRTYEMKDNTLPERIEIDNVVFDHNMQMLKIGDKYQKLTSKEADLLQLLLANINNVVDRSDALNRIWGDDSYFNARSMDVYITKLRKYLKEGSDLELINVHGKGFKIVKSKQS